MTLTIERVWWMALVLAGALVLHLFMLTGVPQPPGTAAAHAHGLAEPDAPPGSTQDDSGAHGAAEMLSTCFAVLALVTAGAAYFRPTHGKPASRGLDSHPAPGGPQSRAARSRHGPSRPSRVDAGVFLRV